VSLFESWYLVFLYKFLDISLILFTFYFRFHVAMILFDYMWNESNVFSYYGYVDLKMFSATIKLTRAAAA